MQELTPKQQRCYDFIKSYVDGYGIAPSIKEIQEALGYPSPKSVQDFIAILRHKGYIAKFHNKARALVILR